MSEYQSSRDWGQSLVNPTVDYVRAMATPRDIDKLEQQAYAEGRKDEAEQHAWRPLETCPEDEHVLLALRLGHYSIGWWTDDGDGRRWFFADKPHPDLTSVAWMPLPQHPEAGSGN